MAVGEETVFPSQETLMVGDDSVEKALMVGDSRTIMQITQRLGQGQTTHGFDFRSLWIEGSRQRDITQCLFAIRIGDGLQ